MPGPILSAVASLVVPGLGQLLNKKYKRGGLLMGLWVLLSAISGVITIGLVMIIYLILGVGTAVDAYRVAKETTTWV